MSNNRAARIAVSLLAGLLVVLGASAASAKVVGFIAEDEDGNYYEYNYDSLLESYVIHLLGGNAPLFSHYSQNKVRAFVDSVNGYVDYDDVLQAYVKALISGKRFDVDEYTASSKAKPAAMPGEVYVVSLGSDGKLRFTKKILDEVKDLLAAVNRAKTAEELESLIISKTKDLGLDLTAFNRLNTYCQNAALAAVLTGRPGGGFASLDRFREAFNKAVSEAQAAYNAAFKAINDAKNLDGMKRALSDHGDILELNLSRYSLKPAERDALASRLLELKPFSTQVELHTLVHTAVIAARSGFTINHTRYDYTLQQMVDIQMSLQWPPQTDLYGGGWKNARREHVEFYANPHNFIDMTYDGVSLDCARITTTLRVRERPTTQSPQVKNEAGNDLFVYQNQVFSILDKAEAEPGTAPGTEGPWYKIRVSTREGWVCGRYVEVFQQYTPNTMFQFLVLSGSAGSTAADLNKILEGKGILEGRGAVFLEAAQANNINEIFLVSLGLHESGNGTSRLAKGIEVEDRDNLFPDREFVTVYNMFGIGAFDSNPNHYGAQFAYDQRWFTPEEAILGGAEFASVRYVNHPQYFQDTLYKMRWNPGRPGVHQYATDIGWAAKQVWRIRSLYNLVDNYTLAFDIPRYRE